ncbi:MAG: LPS export ABC transporter permease LptF [Acetobacteraceae bacterium]|nr:LPS export ABC transporter permease LptF [Acetobacteraceae bacterium]
MRLPPIPTRLDRYIFRQLFWALVVVTLGLTALIWLTQSLRFVELVVNRGLSLVVFMRLTGLLIPSFIAVILPITTYVVIQFIYQRLAGDREVTVMRAAGLSPFSLARPALAVALVAVVSGYWLNLTVVPATLATFKEFQWEIRNKVAAFLLQEGVFTSISDKLVVYVRARSTDGSLHGILVDDARDPAVHATILAESGQLLEGARGPRVLLINGSRQEIDRQTGRLNMLTFRENEIDLANSAGPEGSRPPDMSEMGVADLLHPVRALPRDVPKWIAEAHKRLAGPLGSISYALVALVSVLTGAFQRHGGFIRPLASALTVVLLVASGLTIDGLAARDNTLIPLIWVRAALPGAVCAVLLFGPPLWSGSRPTQPGVSTGSPADPPDGTAPDGTVTA